MTERLAQLSSPTELSHSERVEIPLSQEVVDRRFAEIIATMDSAVSPEMKETLNGEQSFYKLGGSADDANGFGAEK